MSNRCSKQTIIIFLVQTLYIIFKELKIMGKIQRQNFTTLNQNVLFLLYPQA